MKPLAAVWAVLTAGFWGALLAALAVLVRPNSTPMATAATAATDRFNMAGAPFLRRNPDHTGDLGVRWTEPWAVVPVDCGGRGGQACHRWDATVRGERAGPARSACCSHTRRSAGRGGESPSWLLQPVVTTAGLPVRRRSTDSRHGGTPPKPGPKQPSTVAPPPPLPPRPFDPPSPPRTPTP